VPKQDLLAVVQILLEGEELKFASGLRELPALMRELTDVRSTMRSSGRIRMGADGCGEHDDLVIALALACWRARRGQIRFGERRAGEGPLESYRSVEHYDPVLRAHCRLDPT
jgi:hypothetical protein